jgi:hypothetical protein
VGERGSQLTLGLVTRSGAVVTVESATTSTLVPRSKSRRVPSMSVANCTTPGPKSATFSITISCRDPGPIVTCRTSGAPWRYTKPVNEAPGAPAASGMRTVPFG